MAENGQDNSDQLKNIAGSRPSSVAKEDAKSRLKSVKERENEERQKKLDELKAQAQAAQRFKEKKEMERKLRLEEMKLKEDSRRQQVEERKKMMNEAERDRLEAILRRNQEREARIEAKKRNERHSMVFAFGSSTPRMLQPTDSIGSFWGHRRATSTQNITSAAAPLTRRQSERELDGGSKKRATSAGGLERSIEVSPSPQVPAGCASGYVGRRRTDLMPTIPARESPSASSRKSFTRSPAPSRPSSSLSQQSTSSITSSINVRMRPVAAPRRPRPVSIAVTGISTNGTPDKKSTVDKPPLPKTRKSSLVRSTEKLKKKSAASPTDGSPRPLVSPTSSQHASSPVETKPSVKEKTPTKEAKNDDKPTIVASIIATEELVAVKNEMEVDSKEEITTDTIAQVTEQLVDLSIAEKVVQENKEPSKSNENEKEKEKENKEKEKEVVIEKSVQKEPEIKPIVEKPVIEKPVVEKPIVEKAIVEKPIVEKLIAEKPIVEKPIVEKPVIEKPIVEKPQVTEEKVENGTTSSGDFAESSEMTTSMTKVRINTEEEAKAALAERRRLAREEAERQAEMERQRIAEEERLERERQQREEEQQRLLIEKLRQEEEQRLQEAIKEAKRRAEEENQRREEENRIKLLKEESERRAREEAERQKAELQERLKNEEKEREARRKRVEAIMLRTRGKNNAPQQQTEEKNEENKSEKLNGSKVDTPENGHKNGKDIETVDNIIPVETLKNANNVDSLSTDDTLNSNNAWQHNTQTDLLM